VHGIFTDKMRNKYNNKKCVIDGIKFDSLKEGRRFRELKLLRSAENKCDRVVKIITQPKFTLHEGFTDKSGTWHIAIHYIADFWVFYADGKEEIEDVKSAKTFTTNVYKLKKKLFKKKFPNLIFKEIY